MTEPVDERLSLSDNNNDDLETHPSTQNHIQEQQVSIGQQNFRQYVLNGLKDLQIGFLGGNTMNMRIPQNQVHHVTGPPFVLFI